MKVVDNPLVKLVEECILLRESAQRVLSESLGGNALTRMESLVLLSLTEAERPLTASQLGRNLGHLRQVVQRAVNHLIEMGLVTKEDNPDHKTSPLLKPTKRGRRFEQKLGQKLDEVISQALTRADLERCKRARADLRSLREAIEGLQE